MKFIQAKYFTPGNRTALDLIVIHDMEYPERSAGAEWCADFFAGQNGLTAPKASAHYCVDNDSVVQCVHDKDVAWHAPGANHNGIGIEHAGYAKQTREEWLDAYGVAMLELSAGLTASLCAKYGIPAERPSVAELRSGTRGIVGHKDITDAWPKDPTTGKARTHWDPGPGFPWDWYLERVRSHLRLLSAPVAETAGADPLDWPVVELQGIRYTVSPSYIWPIGIGQAAELARELRCELPSPSLVDAIWRAADLKIDAEKMTRSDHDGTAVGMSSLTLFNSQAERLEKLIAGRPYRLLAGYCKDVVVRDGVVGLYGWHRVNGTTIQGFYPKHVRGWIDYSQGLRLVRRV